MLTFEQFALAFWVWGFICGGFVVGWVKPWADRNLRWPWE